MGGMGVRNMLCGHLTVLPERPRAGKVVGLRARPRVLRGKLKWLSTKSCTLTFPSPPQLPSFTLYRR